MTQRGAPQVFQVLPVPVWRVYADGCPDELVRGVDIVGSPDRHDRIMVTADHPKFQRRLCRPIRRRTGLGSVAGDAAVGNPSAKRKHNLMRPPILPPPASIHRAEGRRRRRPAMKNRLNALLLLAVLGLLVTSAPPSRPNRRHRKIRSERDANGDRPFQVAIEVGRCAGSGLSRLRITDIDTVDAQATFGAVRGEVRTRIHVVRVVVRIGDYKQDSFFNQGEGAVDLSRREMTC